MGVSVTVTVTMRVFLESAPAESGNEKRDKENVEIYFSWEYIIFRNCSGVEVLILYAAASAASRFAGKYFRDISPTLEGR